MTREEKLQKKREYYQKNKEREKAKNRKRYQERKEQYLHSDSRKKWVEEHRDKVLEYKRKYAKEHYKPKVGDTHKFCSEPLEYIENYELAKADNFENWVLHHRLEDDGFSMKDLQEKKLYYGRPANELIYMKKDEHDFHHNQKIRKFCKCIETGEIHFVNEWRRLGYPLAGDVANGKYPHHHGFHFEWA